MSEKYAKETVHCKRVFVVTELSNTDAIDFFDQKRSVRYSRMLVLTELVVSGAKCNFHKCRMCLNDEKFKCALII